MKSSLLDYVPSHSETAQDQDSFDSFSCLRSVPGVPSRGTTKADRLLIEALISSELFKTYERAFTQTTGLPVALCSVESCWLPHRGKPNEGRFCALMAEGRRSCDACLEAQAKVAEAAKSEPQTLVCPAGLCETAVPVRLGERLIGFLLTGQVFLRMPSERQFQRTVKLLAKWGVDLDCGELRKAYFGTRVLPARQHASMIKLLGLFAQHLSILSNRILLERNNTQSPMIAKAKAFIQAHHAEKLRMGQVAQFVHVSPFHFCKTFRNCAALKFTDYVSSVRIERSRNLLLNPNLRVREVAYEVGFQSVNHFSRTFRRKLGQSPSRYRSQAWEVATQPRHSHLLRKKRRMLA